MKELDPVIHAQARLRVMTALAALAPDDRITFPRLRQLLDLTAGNLSIHLRRLEDAGYVVIAKEYQRRTPVTYVAMAEAGRAAFQRYRSDLQALLSHPAPERQARS